VRALAVVLVAGVCAGFAAAGRSPQALLPPCLDGGDRSTKLTLIERLSRNPEILVLGSSRARTAEPSFLQRLTGHSGFNAAVKGGDAADAWVMVRFTADHFPRRTRRHLWFVDTGVATSGINAALASEPRARKYLDATVEPGSGACRRTNSVYLPDGSIARTPAISSQKRARILARSVAKLVASIDAHPPKTRNIDPSRYRYFEQSIAFMNQHGSRPVIVLNPIHPRVLAELDKYGFPGRATAHAYLDQLHQTLKFVVVDCQDIRVWGGSAADFDDATHVDRANMRRMLRYVVAHSGGALR
jgi:hypothetical protein